MLDELLGRAPLKRRIEDLEAETHHLERELEAESERRAAAVSARQEAERRVNRLEDRVAELEDRVERATGETTTLTYRRDAAVAGDRRAELLDRLESVSSGPEGILTAYLDGDDGLPEAVRAAFGDRAELVADASPCLAVTDDAGILGTCLSVPVPPEPFVTWDGSVRLERSRFEPTGTHAVALVRSDLFALGEYDGLERTGFRGFESTVGKAHSKGGFSQARFERRRDEQVEDHLERCERAIADRDADPLYVVGERSLLHRFEDRADVVRSVDATGAPESALADAVHSFWSVRVRSV